MKTPLLHLLKDGQLLPEGDIAPSGSAQFIHLCTVEQVAGVRERFFDGGPVLVLVLAPERLEGDVRWEDSYGHGLFPHLYGKISDTAVIRRVHLAAEADPKEVLTPRD